MWQVARSPCLWVPDPGVPSFLDFAYTLDFDNLVEEHLTALHPEVLAHALVDEFGTNGWLRS